MLRGAVVAPRDTALHHSLTWPATLEGSEDALQSVLPKRKQRLRDQTQGLKNNKTERTMRKWCRLMKKKQQPNRNQCMINFYRAKVSTGLSQPRVSFLIAIKASAVSFAGSCSVFLEFYTALATFPSRSDPLTWTDWTRTALQKCQHRWHFSHWPILIEKEKLK